MSNLHAVVMAGGSGVRFWPASRKKRPKQFLPLAHGVSLLQATLQRLSGLCPTERTWIVTNQAQARLIARLLPEFPARQILIEPEARDTAPCVALATAAIAAIDPNATMVLLPADHLIEPKSAFEDMLRRGAALAADGESLVTFGVVPTRPASEYGYVECGARLDEQEPKAFAVRRFREKPDSATAAQFLAQGNFLWNSGIFVWSIAAIRAAMAQGSPDLGASCVAMLSAMLKNDRRALRRAFRRAPRTSIDYAVLEKASRIAVVSADVAWNDVGGFLALPAVGKTDEGRNSAALFGGASLHSLESAENLVYAEGKRTVALFGVSDLVVVAVGDAVLVCAKDKAADMKRLVQSLEQHGRKDLL